MNKLIRAGSLFAGVVGAAIAWASSASAVTFNGTYTVSPYQSSNVGGTGIDISGISPLSFSTSPTFITNLFRISITDAIDNFDDTSADGIGVNFSFTAPPNGGSGTVTGSTTGFLSVAHPPSGPSGDTPGYLQVTWGNSPITINFAGGISLQIALANLTINCTSQNLTCAPSSHQEWINHHWVTVNDYFSGDVAATFSYSVSPGGATGDVPLPAGFPLLASGVALVGWVGRTRSRRKTQA